MVVLVGDQRILEHMIDNNREIHRNSTLFRMIDEAAAVYGVTEIQYDEV